MAEARAVIWRQYGKRRWKIEMHVLAQLMSKPLQPSPHEHERLPLGNMHLPEPWLYRTRGTAAPALTPSAGP